MSYLLSKVALIGAAFAAGGLLRSTGLLSKEDAKAASLFLYYGTLPSLALQTFLLYGFLWWEGPTMACAAILASGLYGLLAWSFFRESRKAERSLFAVSASSVASGSIALGFVEAVFGAVGLHMALLWDLGTTVANSGVSYFMMARGGSIAPERYIHTDGGVYRGIWRGGQKEGLGTYTYPSGARYQGQWENNLKHGLGIYTFPKGGWYEGEWHQGERCGSGVRVKSSGRVQAGIWQGLELVEERRPEEYAFVSTAARDMASAADRVLLGSRGLPGVALQLVSQPLLWTATIAAVTAAVDYQIPSMVDLVTAHLASAHIPLAVLVFGLQTDFDLPVAKQAKDYALAMAVRFMTPLLLATTAAAVLSQRYTDAVAIAAICSLGPISEQVSYYAQMFQLNDVIASKSLSCSRIVSFAALFATTLSMLLLTPPREALSRFGLAISLASVAAVLGVTGSVAYKLLASRRSARGPVALPGKQGQEASLIESPKSKAEPIPIGAAWQEVENRTPAENAPSTQVKTASGSEPVRGPNNGPEPMSQEGLEVAPVRESSLVSSWEQAGSVLVDGGSGQGTAPSKRLDLGDADFELGGRFPNLESAQSSEQGTERAEPLQDKSADRRRRSRRRDQQSSECFGGHWTGFAGHCRTDFGGHYKTGFAGHYRRYCARQPCMAQSWRGRPLPHPSLKVPSLSQPSGVSTPIASIPFGYM